MIAADADFISVLPPDLPTFFIGKDSFFLASRQIMKQQEGIVRHIVEYQFLTPPVSRLTAQ